MWEDRHAGSYTVLHPTIKGKVNMLNMLEGASLATDVSLFNVCLIEQRLHNKLFSVFEKLAFFYKLLGN